MGGRSIVLSFAEGALDDVLHFGRVQVADPAAANDALVVHDDGRRNSVNLPVFRDGAGSSVGDVLPGQRSRRQKLSKLLGLVEGHAENRKGAVAVPGFDQLPFRGKQLSAGDTPGRPKVDQDDIALV